MKKFLVLCLMVLFVGGCGSKDNWTNIDISQASVKLDEKYTNMVDMDDKELSIVYGLDVSVSDISYGGGMTKSSFNYIYKNNAS